MAILPGAGILRRIGSANGAAGKPTKWLALSLPCLRDNLSTVRTFDPAGGLNDIRDAPELPWLASPVYPRFVSPKKSH